MSLRMRVSLSILAISAVVLLLGSAAAVWQAREAVAKEITSSLNLAAQLIRVSYPETKTSAQDLEAWLPRFVSLEQTRHLQILLQKNGGEPARFTAGAKLKSAEDAPPAWFARLVSGHYASVRQQWDTADGGHVTLLIRADPLDEIGEAWKETRTFLLTLATLTALTFIAVNLVFNQAFKAIAVIVAGLQTLEQGHYREKLPEFSTEEYDLIAKAINRLIDVLDAAQRENSALASHSLRIQEAERRHLSQELHDELGQSLTAIKVMAVTLQKPQADRSQITVEISKICDHLLAVVRSMMRQLHPLVLDELGLKAGLDDLLKHWNARQPELSLSLDCSDAVDALDPAVGIQVYRVVQEGITNIVRHARASAAVIRLALPKDNLLTLEISDNGQGCAQASAQLGFGLLGMRERIHSLGGQFSVQSRPQSGMAVTATIPLGSDQEGQFQD